MTATLPAMVNRPSLIEYRHYRFLVMDAPTDTNLPAYIDVLKKKHAVALVRACEPTYKTQPLIAAGIRVIDMPFDDGDPPPEHMLNQWLGLVNEAFGSGTADVKSAKSNSNNNIHNNNNNHSASPTAPTPNSASSSAKSLTDSHAVSSSGDLSSDGKKCIGVHCVAGLGRAPVLVAVALIEAGMQPFEAIEFIRKKRRGAINARQLKYLESYKPKKKLKSGGDQGCIIA